MTKAHYRGAVACIVAFSTTDRESFEVVQKWIDKVEEECGTIPMVLVQNKIDLIDRAVMTTEEADALASKVRLELHRTSVGAREPQGRRGVFLLGRGAVEARRPGDAGESGAETDEEARKASGDFKAAL